MDGYAHSKGVPAAGLVVPRSGAVITQRPKDLSLAGAVLAPFAFVASQGDGLGVLALGPLLTL